MDWFRNIYTLLEKNFFQTLTRKLFGNISFLLLLQVLMFAVTYWNLSTLEGLLTGQSAIPEETLKGIAARTVWQAGSLLILSAVAMTGTFIFLRYLIVVPIRNLNRQLAEMNSGEINLGNQLKNATYDEFRDLAANYNQFLNQLRGTVHKLRDMGINVAVGSTTVVNQVSEVTDKASQQGELSAIIFNNSKETTQTLGQISDHAQHIASSNSESLNSARKALDELQTVNQNMENMLEQINQHDQTIKAMGDKSRDIRKIISTIQGISFQTGLLSLNAAVEAARAGQAGKGF